MGFKPDYGLRLMQDGYPPGMRHVFPIFQIFDVAVLGPGQFSAMVEMPYAGEVLALSLDFNLQQLKQILKKATPQIRELIENELARDPSSSRRIKFDGEVSFGVQASLGEPIKVQQETFVPLIAQEIM